MFSHVNMILDSHLTPSITGFCWASFTFKVYNMLRPRPDWSVRLWTHAEAWSEVPPENELGCLQGHNLDTSPPKGHTNQSFIHLNLENLQSNSKACFCTVGKEHSNQRRPPTSSGYKSVITIDTFTVFLNDLFYQYQDLFNIAAL